MAAVRRASVCLLLLGLAGLCCTEELTPLVAWSNRGGLPSGSSGQCVEELLTATDMDSADLFIVFKASKLSFDDIAKYGGGYKYAGEKSPPHNLQTLVQSATSNVWSGFKGHPASELERSLAEGLQSEVVTWNGAAGAVPPLSEGVLVVELPEGGGGGEDSFARQGAAIAQVMQSVGGVAYIAFYTSDNSPTTSPAVRQRRAIGTVRVDQSSDEKASCGSVTELNEDGIEETCLGACFNLPFVMNATVQSENITYNSVNFTAGSCQNMSELCAPYHFPCLILKAVNTNTSQDVELMLLFVEGGPEANVSRSDILEQGYWRLDVVVTDQRLLRARRNERLFERFTVPQGNSYACGGNSSLNRFEVFIANASDPGPGPNDTMVQFLSGLQAQFNGIRRRAPGDSGITNTFTTAYNCEGYFSVGSWMGSFTVVILLLILYVAVVFMFGMKTIDRFDDPRGPTITVENLH